MTLFREIPTHYPNYLMKTRTTGLTAQELARYLGGPVVVVADESDIQPRNAKLVAVDIMQEEVKVCFDGSRIEYELSPEAIRPVLRKLTTITTEEANLCCKLAYGWAEDTIVNTIVTRGNDYIELYTEPFTLIITAKGVISSSKDSGYRVSPARINARALLMYLESRSFDLDGLLDTKFSVEDNSATE